MPLVEIARFDNPVSAQVARSALESAGIEVVLFDQGISSAYGGALAMTPTRLMVHKDEAAAARALLEAAEDGL